MYVEFVNFYTHTQFPKFLRSFYRRFLKIKFHHFFMNFNHSFLGPYGDSGDACGVPVGLQPLPLPQRGLPRPVPL